MIGVGDVLGFWLDEVGPDKWYATDPGLDAAIAERFGGAVADAEAGKLQDWALTPRGTLALLILLDQFPRNIRRGRSEAFRADTRARQVAKRAIRLGFDHKVPEPERQFFYLPLMHSECNADQDRCVRMIVTRMPETGADNLKHAAAHRDIIRRFGRFPFRNEALGRQSTDDERAWLADGGYRV
jgi:uncharacterized protein (DUF924 family)